MWYHDAVCDHVETDPSDYACGPYSQCINRVLYIECIPGECPSGFFCANQRFPPLLHLIEYV